MNDQERSIKNFVESAFMHGILFAVQFQRRNPNAFNLQEKELEDMARRAAGTWWNKYYRPAFRRFNRIVDKAFLEALAPHANDMKNDSQIEQE